MKTPEECLDFIAIWRYSMNRPSEEEFWEFCDSVNYYLSTMIKNNYNSLNNILNLGENDEKYR